MIFRSHKLLVVVTGLVSGFTELDSVSLYRALAECQLPSRRDLSPARIAAPGCTNLWEIADGAMAKPVELLVLPACPELQALGVRADGGSGSMSSSEKRG